MKNLLKLLAITAFGICCFYAGAYYMFRETRHLEIVAKVTGQEISDSISETDYGGEYAIHIFWPRSSYFFNTIWAPKQAEQMVIEEATASVKFQWERFKLQLLLKRLSEEQYLDLQEKLEQQKLECTRIEAFYLKREMQALSEHLKILKLYLGALDDRNNYMKEISAMYEHNLRVKDEVIGLVDSYAVRRIDDSVVTSKLLRVLAVAGE